MRGRFVAVTLALAVLVAACSSGSSAASGPPLEVRSIANPDLIVFMDPGATPAQTDAVRRAVRRSDAVDRYSFTSHAAAYREMQKFEQGSDLASVTRPSDLPESFGLVLAERTPWRPLAARLARRGGVQAVKIPTSSRRSVCRDLLQRKPKPPAWLRQQCADATDGL